MSFPGPGICHLSRPSGQEAPGILTPPGLSVLVQGIDLGGCVGHLTPASSAAIYSINHTRPWSLLAPFRVSSETEKEKSVVDFAYSTPSAAGEEVRSKLRTELGWPISGICPLSTIPVPGPTPVINPG